VAVHQFCHVDSYSFLAGGSMVDRDVPIYMMVSGDRAELRGLNLEGLWRCGFSDPEVKSIQQTYQKFFMNSDTEAGGLEDRLATLVCT
jgi:UDP-N-acetylglucosamine acyltransferase